MEEFGHSAEPVDAVASSCWDLAGRGSSCRGQPDLQQVLKCGLSSSKNCHHGAKRQDFREPLMLAPSSLWVSSPVKTTLTFLLSHLPSTCPLLSYGTALPMCPVSWHHLPFGVPKEWYKSNMYRQVALPQRRGSLAVDWRSIVIVFSWVILFGKF